MDGIPVKINEKYKPPPRRSLPACTLNRLNNVQFKSYTYDFSLENTVTQHMTKLNQISREEIDKHEAKSSPETSPEIPAYSENGLNEPTILTPTPISSNPVRTLQKENAFKYSDFENDTSSPFDNEELKTLNDLEELAHVLGATSVSGRSEEDNRVVGGQWPQVGYGSPSQSQFYQYNPTVSTSHPGLSCPTYSTLSSYQPYIREDKKPSFSRENKIRTNVQKDGRVSEIVKSLQNYLGQRKNGDAQPQIPHNSASYNKLTEQQQQMARQLADMGFPLSRTVEAVKNFTDESKIIEYLLLVESLVDKGYSESQVLHALEVSQCDEKSAENYLKVLEQIMRLGFKEDEVVNALARTKNDRDKALDILIR